MKEKGFTLIELLAVIVILAVIALITTPVVLNMIESARKSAAKDSAYGYIEGINYSNGLNDYDKIEYEEITETEVKEINKKIKVKGEKAVSGKVTYNKNGIVESATLCIGGYNVEYKNKEAIVKDKCDSTNICKYSSGDNWEFTYKGEEETFEVPCTGTYKLETWGAQGGSTSEYIGGHGGYSTGTIKLSKNQNIYINVGGKGIGSTIQGQSLVGGYNGGGSVTGVPKINHMYGSGGGATHISTKTGLLSTLSNAKDKILIVAGGGGGSRDQSNHVAAARFGNGGSGGGIIGGGAVNNYNTTVSNIVIADEAGTQTGGYKFGLGETGVGNAGGGAGWYGARNGNDEYNPRNPYTGSASGGSGYIGNSKLSNKVMYCYNCEESNEESTKTISTNNVSEVPISNYAKIGNGHAKIIFIGE